MNLAVTVMQQNYWVEQQNCALLIPFQWVKEACLHDDMTIWIYSFI